MTRKVTSVAAMQEFATEIAGEVQGGGLLLLYGELGAGKTTFVQGLARALGVQERVTSPTFTIVGEYVVSPPAGGGDQEGVGALGVSALAHVDLYRLDEKTAATDPAVQDVLERADEPGRLTVIEWADRLGEAAPAAAKRIYFQHGEASGERVVEYDAMSDSLHRRDTYDL